MKLTLKRKYLKDNYTIGDLFVDDVFICNTLEDKVRDFNKDGDLLDEGEDKVYGETAIPYGTYDIELSMSPKFKRILPMILKVPHFTGIRIHKMGTDKKPGTAKWSEGCVGVGENKVMGGIINSEKYEMDLIQLMLTATYLQDPIRIIIE